MARKEYKTASYIVAISIAVLGGLSLWRWGSPYEQIAPNPGKRPPSLPPDATRVASGDQDAAREAREYASAVRTGDCETVLALTWWMQERLERVAAFGAGPGEVEKTRRELCESIQARAPERNLLTSAGAEDQYLFAPSAQFDLMYVDKGQPGLEKPVRERAWFRITYPSASNALRDETGRPIRSLFVALSISMDGYILKAGVAGNAEIDWDSIIYNTA